MAHAFWIGESHMDEMQKQAVLGIPATSSFIIKGPAGSGKTNILLLRAKWLKLKSVGEFKIVVFTGSLKVFVREGCVQYGIPPDSVVTAMQLFKELLSEYGVEYELTGNFVDDRHMLAGKVKALIDERDIRGIYPVVLVDEAQDYIHTELLVFRQLAENLVLAADSRQSIYDVKVEAGMLESLVDGNIVILKYHYRSGLNLCIVADAVLRDSANFPPIQGECKYPENIRPSSLVPFECASFAEQVGLIIRKLEAQLSLYPDERIGVMFPKNIQLDKFREALKLSGFSGLERVWIDTLHGCKGWEFRAVHIGGCEELSSMRAVQKRLVYTGILRAKTSVSLYYTGSIPPYLDGAIAKLSAPVEDPEFDDLFGG
ncbi:MULTISPECIES: AAA family ATPase [unclassified Pseudomonas]|uniref:AAA family ATPase n=1 Tax=unclassified Pseudomonas TaxID=196821 RepID=UPI001CC06F27|nr:MULTISPECIES: AAA family ATPase [unclassified Pseudomonas]